MTLKVNGTIIPETNGSAKVGGTNLTEIIVNGTTVWKPVVVPPDPDPGWEGDVLIMDNPNLEDSWMYAFYESSPNVGDIRPVEPAVVYFPGGGSATIGSVICTDIYLSTPWTSRDFYFVVVVLRDGPTTPVASILWEFAGISLTLPYSPENSNPDGSNAVYMIENQQMAQHMKGLRDLWQACKITV